MAAARRLGAATLVALATVAACRNPERAPYDFERMRRQQKYEPYGASRFFADGKAMQAPPAGTVSREALLLPTGGGAAGAAGLPATPVALAAGRDRFAIYCAVCHGAAGFGGSIVATNMGPPRPRSLHTPAVRAMSADSLYRIVTLGIGRMGPHGWQLDPAQRWAVVAYVQALARLPATDTAAIRDSTVAAQLQALDSTRLAGGAP